MQKSREWLIDQNNYNMNNIELIKKLRSKLEIYTQSEEYKLNNYSKDIVSAIEIAINLMEIADRNSTKIRKEDRSWFEGEYQISRNFDDPKWDEIGILYSQLASIAKRDFFP